MRELLKQNHLIELDKLITVLEGLTVTPNGHNRKGGLIGLAAVAIALGKDVTFHILNFLFDLHFSIVPNIPGN